MRRAGSGGPVRLGRIGARSGAFPGGRVRRQQQQQQQGSSTTTTAGTTTTGTSTSSKTRSSSSKTRSSSNTSTSTTAAAAAAALGDVAVRNDRITAASRRRHGRFVDVIGPRSRLVWVDKWGCPTILSLSPSPSPSLSLSLSLSLSPLLFLSLSLPLSLSSFVSLLSLSLSSLSLSHILPEFQRTVMGWRGRGGWAGEGTGHVGGGTRAMGGEEGASEGGVAWMGAGVRGWRRVGEGERMGDWDWGERTSLSSAPTPPHLQQATLHKLYMYNL